MHDFLAFPFQYSYLYRLSLAIGHSPTQLFPDFFFSPSFFLSLNVCSGSAFFLGREFGSKITLAVRPIEAVE